MTRTAAFLVSPQSWFTPAIDQAALQRRWLRLWSRVASSKPERELRALTGSYGQRHRHYHTLDHVAVCLAVFDAARACADRPEALELAIWFHDAVYRPFSSLNEQRSAHWAEVALERGGADLGLTQQVRSLILVTRHPSLPESPDEELMVDIDLAILGAPPAIHAAYEIKIRQEYRLVPDRVYRRSRASLLRSFLGRNTVFSTDLLRQALEAQARRNLEAALRRLTRKMVKPDLA